MPLAVLRVGPLDLAAPTDGNGDIPGVGATQRGPLELLIFQGDRLDVQYAMLAAKAERPAAYPVLLGRLTVLVYTLPVVEQEGMDAVIVLVPRTAPEAAKRDRGVRYVFHEEPPGEPP